MDGKTIALLTSCLWLVLAGEAAAQNRQKLIGEAAELHSLGANYINEGVWDSAFHFTQLAARKREDLFADSLCVDLGKSNYNAGYALQYRSLYAEARPYLERALEVFNSIRLPPQHAHRLPATYLELARVYAGTGNYEKAKNQLRLAAAVTRAATDTTMNGLNDLYPKILSEWSGILMVQDSLARAVALGRSAILAYEALPYYYSGNLDARSNLANALNKKGDYAAARREYATLITDYAEEEDYSNLLIIQNNLADMLVRMGLLREARRTLGAAGKTARAVGDRTLTAQYKDHLGTLLEAEGKYRLAAAAFQEAQAFLLPDYAPKSITEAPPHDQLRYANSGADLFLYINDQARTLGAMEGERAGFTDARLRLYRSGDALLDGLRNDHGGEATKLFWRQKALPFYEAAIRTSHLAGRPDDAFYFFEKSKAVLLYEALAGNDALRQLPDSLQARDAELATMLTAAKAALPSARDRTTGLRTLVDAQAALDGFREQLRREFPRYRSLTENVVVPEPTGFYSEQLAPANQVLVHYFYGPEQTYALVLDANGPKTVNLGRSDALSSQINRLLAYFRSPAEIPNDPAGYAAAASAAYDALIRPLHLRPRQKIVVIPDGPLTYLPFPALLTEPSTGNRLGDLPYLIRRHAISYGHSAAILSRKRPPEKSAAGITAFAPFTDGSSPLDYPPLPFSQDELSSVSKNYSTKLFKDSAATLSAFRSANKTGNILHLSTHAFSSRSTQSPLIAFHDQPLYLSDLYHETLSADLVILSACQTNVGKFAGGEGVLGLGRGFIQAGATSIVASLWNVNARGSGRILGNFYQQLNTGKTKGTALHEAQLDYLEDTTLRDLDKSPYLWAGFTYYGNEGLLTLEPTLILKTQLWATVIAVVLFACFLFFFIKTRGKN